MVLTIDKTILKKIPYKKTKLIKLLQAQIFKHIQYNAKVINFERIGPDSRFQFRITYNLDTQRDNGTEYHGEIILEKKEEESLY